MKNPKICMEPKRTSNGNNNLEKVKQNWRYHSHLFYIILKSYRNQNSVVVAQKQINGMEKRAQK